MEMSGKIHATLREISSGTNWIGGWVDLRAGLDAVVKRKIPYPFPGMDSRSYRP
jgi:hypothetical protein